MGGEGRRPGRITDGRGRCVMLEKVVTVVGFVDRVTAEQRPEKDKEGTKGFSRKGVRRHEVLERGPRRVASTLQEGAWRAVGGGRKHRGAIIPV